MKRFLLVRNIDVSGVSGIGTVAEGVIFTNGKVVINWLGSPSSIVIWESIDDVIKINCHGGKTEIIYV